MGIWGRKRKALCKLTPYDNCPVREDRRETSWSLHTYLVCLGFLQLSTLLLYSFSRLLSVLGCPAHLSPFIVAHINWQLTCFLNVLVSLLF